MAGATQHLHGKKGDYVLWGTVGRETESRNENKMAPVATRKATNPHLATVFSSILIYSW